MRNENTRKNRIAFCVSDSEMEMLRKYTSLHNGNTISSAMRDLINDHCAMDDLEPRQFSAARVAGQLADLSKNMDVLQEQTKEIAQEQVHIFESLVGMLADLKDKEQRILATANQVMNRTWINQALLNDLCMVCEDKGDYPADTPQLKEAKRRLKEELARLRECAITAKNKAQHYEKKVEE